MILKLKKRTLLTLDAVVNILLGLVLVFAPFGTTDFLGLPPAGSFLYSSVLGAVLIGIGLALLIARSGASGLGLAGAIAINLSGGLSVVIWLLAAPAARALPGRFLLWGIALAVLLIGIVELRSQAWKRYPDG
jgi:hypothetical protein